MKRLLLAAVSVVAMAAPAVAADMRPVTKAPAAPAPVVQVYNWTGFYIGGHVGGAFAGNDTFNGSDGRFLGGGQVGFDYQFAPNWVVGIEGQYCWLGGNNATMVWRSRLQASPRSTIEASARSPDGSAMPGVRCCSMERAATRSRIAIST